MSYEANSGLGVNNHYGPRKSGGAIGEIETDGLTNRQFVLNLDAPHLPVEFPRTAKCYVTGFDTVFTTGTVTSLKIGDIEIADDEVLPKEITIPAEGEDLLVTQVGGTAGTIIIYFAQAAQA